MKWKTTAALLSATTFIAFGGALAGTLAWYSYATRASISYGGTSVYSTEQLQMGLVTSGDVTLLKKDDEHKEVKFEDAYTKNTSLSTANTYYYFVNDGINTDFTQVVEEVESDKNGIKTVTKRYWFTPPGAGLSHDDMDIYFDKTSSMKSAKTLIPVSTREFDNKKLANENITLYSSPAKGEDDRGFASETDYTEIPFAFRVVTSDGTYVKNQNIWLTGANNLTAKAASAVRLYFSSDTTSVLFNPSSEEDGTNTVAGLLDLDRDGYYDVTGFDYETGNGTEYIYGLFDKQPSTTTTFDTDLDGADSDVNGYYNDDANPSYEKNTFYAHHKKGDKGFKDLSSLDLPKSHYSGKKTIFPNDKGGELSEGTVLTNTSSDLAIGELNMTVFMEGWDFGVIDKNCEYEFDLGLTFQINKV